MCVQNNTIMEHLLRTNLKKNLQQHVDTQHIYTQKQSHTN